MDRSLVALGGLLGFMGVGLGAFGSHGLRDRVDEPMLAVWQTAVLYHLVHSLAILLVAVICERFPRAKASGYLFVSGTLVFSGSLYFYVLTGTRAFAMVTPLGGVLFLVGWAWLLYSSLKSP